MNVLSTTEAATRSPGHTHQQLSWAALSALSLRRADSFFSRRCYNSPGSFTCGQCPLGTFTGDGKSGCVDVDECTSGTSVCDPLTQCKVHALSICLVGLRVQNIAGGYMCTACPVGYEGSGRTGCVDVDECSRQMFHCDSNAVCVNTMGSYRCACKPGVSHAPCYVLLTCSYRLLPL